MRKWREQLSMNSLHSWIEGIGKHFRWRYKKCCQRTFDPLTNSSTGTDGVVLRQAAV